MKDRPILFSSPMVRAILDGRKTVTRRVVLPQPEHQATIAEMLPAIQGTKMIPERAGFFSTTDGYGCYSHGTRVCPYGQSGDRLWVREMWRPLWDGIDVPGSLGDCVQYRADMAKIKPRVPDEDTGFRFDDMCDESDPDPKWKPSIFMSRWISRITLEITGVKVERIQGVSEEDAFAEGIERGDPGVEGWGRFCYRKIWNSINEKRGFGWDANPWVWAISFRRIR